jgi:dTDP-4-amino-4,6-dideoxygalactose transaminase
MSKIPFSKAAFFGPEVENVRKALSDGLTSGDHFFTKKCHEWLKNEFSSKHVLLTTSGTHALELAAISMKIKPGDEVIMPSFTFSSTANAFALRGARICFVDVNPGTMNADADKILNAINSKTKAVILVHYAGMSTDLSPVLEVCQEKGIFVVEDAAQAFHAKYNSKPLGTLGNFGCLSFHETKNISSGEGGACFINDDHFTLDSEIIREKGTNRVQFFRGEVDKYTWLQVGSSYLPSDLIAAVLLVQLENSAKITERRVRIWNSYHQLFAELEAEGYVQRPVVPAYSSINGHIYFLKAPNKEVRTKLIQFLKTKEIHTAFHYIPLHSAPAGLSSGYFAGEDQYTTVESERLLRLPLFFDLPDGDVQRVFESIREFFKRD